MWVLETDLLVIVLTIFKIKLVNFHRLPSCQQSVAPSLLHLKFPALFMLCFVSLVTDPYRLKSPDSFANWLLVRYYARDTWLWNAAFMMQEFSSFDFVSLVVSGDSSSFPFICTHAKAQDATLDGHLNHQSQDFPGKSWPLLFSSGLEL